MHERRKHILVRPYKCAKCDFFFFSKGDLKRHEQRLTPCDTVKINSTMTAQAVHQNQQQLQQRQESEPEVSSPPELSPQLNK